MTLDPKEKSILFSQIFDTPAGEKVLLDLEIVCDARCADIGIPPQKKIDQNHNLYLTGMRSVYWYIYSLVEHGRKAARDRVAGLTEDTHGSR